MPTLTRLHVKVLRFLAWVLNRVWVHQEHLRSDNQSFKFLLEQTRKECSQRLEESQETTDLSQNVQDCKDLPALFELLQIESEKLLVDEALSLDVFQERKRCDLVILVKGKVLLEEFTIA